MLEIGKRDLCLFPKQTGTILQFMVFASGLSYVTLHFAPECCHTSATRPVTASKRSSSWEHLTFCLWLLMTKKQKLQRTCGSKTALRKNIFQMLVSIFCSESNTSTVYFCELFNRYFFKCVPSSALVEVGRIQNVLQWGSEHRWEIFFFYRCIKLHLLYFSDMFWYKESRHEIKIHLFIT